MRPVAELADATNWMQGKLLTARQDLNIAIVVQGRDRLSALSLLFVDLHNALRMFLRCYYLSSALGARDADGQPTTSKTGARNQHEAMGFAISAIRGSHVVSWTPRDEPTWHDIGIVIRLFNLAQCSNAGGFASAWSVGSRASEYLTITRNFYAHRQENTALKVRRVARAMQAPARGEPGEIALQRGAGRPQSLIEDWLDDIEVIVQLIPR
jgi:hypothetical protein